LVPTAIGGFVVLARLDDRIMARKLTLVPAFVTSSPDASTVRAGSHLPFLDLRAVHVKDERRLASFGLSKG
jgi:hypothetical protein